MRILGASFEIIEVDITNSLLPSDLFSVEINTCCPSGWNGRVAKSDMSEKPCRMDVDSESVQSCQAEVDYSNGINLLINWLKDHWLRSVSWLPLLDAGG
ncbi:hypothetical protein I7I53_08369 [Histoplasma capsulatum var. duboisii H88]|uniref:Uncharacterized protein n=1 Tax=Ajellomyces capsulatus (strain H88) TaxID=544711 RepID=A0A8A1LLF4_AJEC8|nr:hypothetical protein I7I53_08369 [Histoplasma capsulatum var. duboisii H88]